MRFLLDEDVHPEAARIARGRGVDVVSVHEIARTGLDDESQLRYAAADERAFVTRNRDDFLRLTIEFFRSGRRHAGVLILPRSIPNRQPDRIAAAIQQYAGTHHVEAHPHERMEPYTFDFLSPPSG